MLKYLSFLLIICAITSCVYTTGSGNIISEKRNVTSFHGVSASQGFDVEIKIGPVPEVIIEVDDNLIDDVKTSVNGGILRISLDKRNVNSAHLKAFVTATTIDNLKTSSSASILTKDELNADGNIEVEASSGSNITALLNAPSVNAQSSSGSEITLSGRTKDFDAKSSSGASLKAFDLLSENTQASASSGATVHVHASVKLDASASSGANINYRGGADVVKSASSGGEVRKE